MSSRSQSSRWRSSRRCSAAFIAALYVFFVQCGPSTWPGGVHAVFGWSSEAVRVADVPADGPAARAGLLPGDRLIAIDGSPVAGLSSSEVQKRLGGEVGSVAVLAIERDGKPLEIRVERAPYRRAERERWSADPT